MSLSEFRGAWFAPGVPTAPRGAPGTSLVSGGNADTESSSLSVPAFGSSDSVVTMPVTERRGGDIARAPTVVAPRIPTVSPTQSLQLCQEGAETGATFRIVRGEAAEAADAPDPLPLLCASRKRPRCCTAHNAEKLPPPHNAPRESIVAVQTTTMIGAEGMP